VYDAPDFSVRSLKAQMKKLVEMDIPLIRRRLPIQEAIDRYTAVANGTLGIRTACRSRYT